MTTNDKPPVADLLTLFDEAAATLQAIFHAIADDEV